MKQMLKRACMGVVLFILTLTMAACSTETIEPATSKFSTGSDDANTIPTDDLETSLLPNEAFENVLLNQRQFFTLILTAIPSIKAMYTSLRLQGKIKVRCPFQSLLL